MLIELKDDWITDIEYDMDQYNDYGDWMDSSCTSYLTHYTHDFKINFTTDQMELNISLAESDDDLSPGSIIKLFISNADNFKKLTKLEFCDWLRVQLEELSGCMISNYDLERLETTIKTPPELLRYSIKPHFFTLFSGWVDGANSSDTSAEK